MILNSSPIHAFDISVDAVFGNEGKVFFVFENFGNVQVARFFHINAAEFPTPRSREGYGKRWALQCLRALQYCHEIGLYIHDFNFYDVLVDKRLNAKIWNFDKMYLGMHKKIKTTTNMSYRCPEGLGPNKCADVFSRFAAFYFMSIYLWEAIHCDCVTYLLS